MVRGDAYRLAGHEDEASEAYLAAARGGLPERRRRSRTRPARTETGATEWTDGTDGTDAVEGADPAPRSARRGPGARRRPSMRQPDSARRGRRDDPSAATPDDPPG